MANYPLLWPLGVPFKGIYPSSYAQTYDARWPYVINTKDGSTHTPTAIITINGSGMSIQPLSSTDLTIPGVGTLVTGAATTSTFNGAATFNGTFLGAGTSSFSAGLTISGAGALNAALIVLMSAGNKDGAQITGHGSGAGIIASSGAGNGVGVQGTGNGTAAGVLGINAGTGAGVQGAGGTNGRGVVGIGNGAGAGADFTGGATGAGVIAAAGGNNHGVIASGSGSGAGVSTTGGSASGTGLVAQGGAPNGIGLAATGVGTGNAINAAQAGSGFAIHASGPSATSRAVYVAQGTIGFASSGPSATTDPGADNVATAAAVAKSWGVITITSAPSIALTDGYNVASVAFVGTTSIRVDFVRPMASGTYAVAIQKGLLGTRAGMEYQADANGFDITPFDYGSSVGVDPHTMREVSFIVFGRQ